jgi:hypothetical protein
MLALLVVLALDSAAPDLDGMLGRFHAGAAGALRDNAECLEADRTAWQVKRRRCPDAACRERLARERLGELAALQPGINLPRDFDFPGVPQLIGALAPEPDRIMAPPIASRPGSATGALVYDEQQGAFVIREAPGRQAIVLLDIMRHGDNATQFPVMEETSRGARVTARGRLAVKSDPPQFDRRHCVLLYRLPP